MVKTLDRAGFTCTNLFEAVEVHALVWIWMLADDMHKLLAALTCPRANEWRLDADFPGD